ncbi:general substrate transporter [Aspergillus pseudoustus]|uniref:General substrate transporter n=1 Tax=Aspergillus pseudoustus TaxID=1810923 RepID=A0ABR4IG02_9EURO
MAVLHLKGRALRVALHFAAGLNFLLFGYDQGLLGGVINTPQFINAYGHQPTDTIIGTVSAIYSIGAFFGAVLAAICGLRMGRRIMLMVSCCCVIVGAAIQAAAPNLGAMIAGRIITGFGVGISTSTVPIWISETSNPVHRGRMVAIQLEIVLIGFMFSYWFDYGMSYVQSEVSFRLPIALQALFPIISLPVLYILPESPRVLCAWGRLDEGVDVLARLHDLPVTNAHIVSEKDQIIRSIEIESEINGKVLRTLFLDKSDIKYRRRALTTLVIFLLQQFGGCTFVGYYAPIIFETSVGLSQNISSIMSCAMATTYAVGGTFPILMVDRLGRRKMMLWGAAATSSVFITLTVLVSQASKSESIGWGAAIMVLIFIQVFAMTWNSLPWIYGSELMPLNMRHINGAIGAGSEFLFQFTVLEMAPSAIASTGWRIYIFFAVFNVLSFFFVYAFCPETVKKTLEEIDFIYIKSATDGLEVTMPAEQPAVVKV